MYREIKFRGKRKDNGEWVYSHGIYKNKWGNVFMLYERLTLPYSPKMDGYGWVEVIPETVGQYLGKINGKEVYEGDVAKYRDIFGYERSGMIVYDENTKTFVFEYLEDGKVHRHDILFAEDIEIIGNIHEKSELLGALP